MYLGKANIRSLATAVVLAEMLVAMTERAQQKAEKNMGARSIKTETWSGFQVDTPYITSAAEVTTTPKIAHIVTSLNISSVSTKKKGNLHSERDDVGPYDYSGTLGISSKIGN
jgi:hypothetical protein